MAVKVLKYEIAISKKNRIVFGLFLFAWTLSFFSDCTKKNENQITYLNHHDSVAYVGMEVCASCHSEKHSTFIHTGMGKSFDRATKAKSSARFGKEHIVYDSLNDLYYYPHWKGERLYVLEFRLFRGDTLHQLDKKIDYIVGSGQHTNSHIIKEQAYLFQAPITFYVQEERWDLAPGFEAGNNSRFSRILNVECISCHNSMPEMQQNSASKFESIGQGIDCERCHGPGALHVAERIRGKGENVRKSIDPTIVNPAKLSWERQIDLCQRCHLQGLNILKEGKQFTDYKPGMMLKDVFEIFLPLYEGGKGKFDMANHAERFQLSPCFIKSNSDGNFTCISCHNPHISVQHTGNEVYNTACKQCHKEHICTISPAEMAKAENNCVNCHMPQRGAADIPHVSVHDHYIRKPLKEDQGQSIEKVIGLYSVNNPEPAAETQIRAYLEYWEKFDKNPLYLTKAGELLKQHPISKLRLKYYYLKEEYKNVIAAYIQLKEDIDHWTAYMIGESYLQTNQPEQALDFFRMSYRLDQGSPARATKLARLYIKLGKYTDARLLLNELEREFPGDGEICNLSAMLYILNGEMQSAEKLLKKALQLEPDKLSVWETNFNYFLRKGDKKATTLWAKLILQGYPNHPSAAQMKKYAEDVK